jgi:hypothetical protein
MHAENNLATIHALDEQPMIRVTTDEFEKAVIDDLIDKDLVGLLLSTNHLLNYFVYFHDYACPAIAKIIMRHINHQTIIHELNESLLKRYSCLYIAESEYKTKVDLHKALDAKFADYVMNLGGKSRNETLAKPTRSLPAIEMAWKYRSLCI